MNFNIIEYFSTIQSGNSIDFGDLQSAEEGLFGAVEKVVSTKELIDNKTLANLNIECIVLKHKEEDCKLVKDYSYAEEINYLVLQPDRNNFISRLCSSLQGNTLCLYQLVEKHGTALYALMKDFDRKVFFVHGGTDAKTRNDIRGIVEKEKKLKQIIQLLLIFGGESLKSRLELKGKLKDSLQKNQMNISTQGHCNQGLLQLFQSKVRK